MINHDLIKDLEQALSLYDWWTPSSLKALRHPLLNVSDNAIRMSWINRGVIINGKKIHLRAIRSGKRFVIHRDWLLDFVKALNPARVVG